MAVCEVNSGETVEEFLPSRLTFVSANSSSRKNSVAVSKEKEHLMTLISKGNEHTPTHFTNFESARHDKIIESSELGPG